MTDKIQETLNLSEAAGKTLGDVGLKIVLDTVMSKDGKQKIVIDTPGLIAKGAVSGIYYYWLEDSIMIKLKGDTTMGMILSWASSIFIRSVAEMLTIVVWNTVLEFVKKRSPKIKMGKKELLQQQKTGLMNILISNVIGSSVWTVWEMIKSEVEPKQQQTKQNNVILEK
jgi:hypothetical protein